MDQRLAVAVCVVALAGCMPGDENDSTDIPAASLSVTGVNWLAGSYWFSGTLVAECGLESISFALQDAGSGTSWQVLQYSDFAALRMEKNGEVRALDLNQDLHLRLDPGSLPDGVGRDLRLLATASCGGVSLDLTGEVFRLPEVTGSSSSEVPLVSSSSSPDGSSSSSLVLLSSSSAASGPHAIWDFTFHSADVHDPWTGATVGTMGLQLDDLGSKMVPEDVQSALDAGSGVVTLQYWMMGSYTDAENVWHQNWALVRWDFGSAIDFSQHQVLCIRYAADANFRFQIGINGTPNYDSYGVELASTNGLAMDKNINMATLTQEGWGAPYDLDLSVVNSFAVSYSADKYGNDPNTSLSASLSVYGIWPDACPQ